MCLNPGTLANGQEVACRKCKQCLDQRVNDWIGRCIAESKTAIAAHSISLTYGRDEGKVDHPAAAWLTYSHVQEWLTTLRMVGYRPRYLFAGEYGGQKGRAHWHGLLFWYPTKREDGRVCPPHQLSRPELNQEYMFNDQYWKHGHQYWRAMDAEASARYACKYIVDEGKDTERQSMLRMSKKPPLGDAYFRQLAEKYVSQGISPRDLKYTFPGVVTSEGKPRQFYMHATTGRNFLDHFVRTWSETHAHHYPQSDLIDEHLDWIVRQTYLPERDRFHVAPAPPSTLIETAAGQWETIRGTAPLAGTDPATGLSPTNYSDLHGHRHWYRKVKGEGFQWVRETISDLVRRRMREEGMPFDPPDE